MGGGSGGGGKRGRREGRRVMVGRLGKGEFREERGLETHLLPYLVSLCVLHCQVAYVVCLWQWRSDRSGRCFVCGIGW